MKYKVAELGMYVSVMIIASYLETWISFPFLTPGIKLGLSNLFVVLILYLHGWKSATIVSLIRVVLVGFMFGNLYTIMYSLSGAVLSLMWMHLGKSLNKLSVVGVSILGAIGHNIGQMLMAIMLLKTLSIRYYFMVLLISALVTGMIIGKLVEKILGRMLKVLQ